MVAVFPYCLTRKLLDELPVTLSGASDGEKVYPKVGTPYTLVDVQLSDGVKRSHRVSSVAFPAPPLPVMSNQLITRLNVRNTRFYFNTHAYDAHSR